MPSEWAECAKCVSHESACQDIQAITSLSQSLRENKDFSYDPTRETPVQNCASLEVAHTCTCLAEQFTAMSHCSSVYTNWTSVQKKSSCHQPCFKRKINSVVEVLLLDMLLCYMYMLVVFSQVLCLTSLPSSTKTKFNKRPNNKTIQLIWRYHFVQKVFFSQH